MVQSAHAELSGSGAHRWIRCPGSIALTRAARRDGSAPSSSPYAREGTFAHAVGAHCLQYDLTEDDIRNLAGQSFEYDDHGEKIISEIPGDMVEHIITYVNRIRHHALTGVVDIERHVSLEDLVREEMWGTLDAGIWQPDNLVVADLKYGYTPVILVDYDLLLDDTWGELGHINSQLLYYAAGAMDADKWRLPNVTLEIIQPRCSEVPAVQSTQIDATALRQWAENDLWKAAHLATSENAPLNAGKWCQFCPAMDICPEVRKVVQQAATTDFAELITKPIEVPDRTEHLVQILTWAPIIDAWLRACEVSAFEHMQSGNHLPGFKLVRKQTHRKWPTDDPSELMKRLKKAGLPVNVKAELLSERKLKSPAQLEESLGKKYKAIINTVAEWPEGDLTVARSSDRKPAVNVTAGDDFAELKGDALDG